MEVKWTEGALKDLKRHGFLASRPVYYLWYAPKRKLGDAWWKIKKIPFRIRRGFWPDEVWSLDDTIAKFVIPRLKYLREIAHSYPSNLVEYDSETMEELPGQDGFELWKSYLDKMIWSFEWAASDSGKNWEKQGWWSKRYLQDEEYRKEIDSRYEEGMNLFAKYFSALWD